MKLDYDERFDVLYVALGDKSNSYGDDSVDGLIVMRDMGSGAITGVTLSRFAAKFRANSLPKLSEILDIPDYVEPRILQIMSEKKYIG